MMIQTKYGKVRGMEMAHSWVFKGIPYAKPPIGELRFAPPQKPDTWDGVLECDHWRAQPIQPPENVEECLPDGTRPFADYSDEQKKEYEVEMDEDCLYLNIWMPKEVGRDEGKTMSPKKYPVIFYVFGGGFLSGNGNQITLDGDWFCKNEVIFVTFNYRLGVFGYFACKELVKEQKTSGNYGTLDQIAALEWVRENISAFGGNPENITVMGHSAGGMSTQVLISSPLTKGMIRRVSMHSGGGYPFGMYRSLESACKQGQELMELLQVDTVADLRKLPAQVVFGAGMAVMAKWMEEKMQEDPTAIPLMYVPTDDGTVLVGSLNDAFEKGMVQNVECILGSCKNDVGVSLESIKMGIRDSSIYTITKEFAIRQNMEGKKPCYVYYFMHDLPGDTSGAPHCMDGNYIMHTLGRSARPFTERDLALEKELSTRWANFAKTGVPFAENGQEWRPCTKMDEFVMDFA